MLTKGSLVLGVWAGRHPTAAHDGDGRGGCNYGECDARGEPQVMLGAPRGPMDGTRVIWWLGRHRSSARWRRHPWRAARQGWGGSTWCAQGRAATLNRCSVVTGCWRRRCRRGAVVSRRTHVWRARGSDRRSARCTPRVWRDGEATCARLKMRHIWARTHRDAGPRAARGADTKAGRRAGARDIASLRRHGLNVLPVHYLKWNNSKNLYRSVQNFEIKSCRSQYHLQLSQRPYVVFLNRFCKRSLLTLNVNLCPWIGGTVIWASFSSFSTQNLKCQSIWKLCPYFRDFSTSSSGFIFF
jgi:hypothetical protein